MEHTFSGIVDKVYKLPLEDKQQLLDLLENNIAEERRNDIYKNYLSALKDFQIPGQWSADWKEDRQPEHRGFLLISWQKIDFHILVFSDIDIIPIEFQMLVYNIFKNFSHIFLLETHNGVS